MVVKKSRRTDRTESRIQMASPRWNRAKTLWICRWPVLTLHPLASICPPCRKRRHARITAIYTPCAVGRSGKLFLMCPAR
jgi:hypothetical protein